MSKTNRRVSPVLAGLAVLAVPVLSQTVAQAARFPIIHFGSHGPAVKTAESQLQHLGYYHGAIDGAFGPLMLNAVKEFQGHYGLAQDGVVGPLTWEKLSAAVSTPDSTTSNASPQFESAPEPLLKYGMRGTAVQHLQKLLDQHGYHLATDGVFGPLTYGAVRNFQASRGLAVDGIVGAATWKALTATENQVAAPMEAAPASYPPGYLHEGDRGSSVATLQRDLTRLGYNTYGVDGIFGPDTYRALVAFQSAHHLPAHGLVGELTWHALDTALASSKAQSSSTTTIAGNNTLADRGTTSPTADAIVGLALKYRGAAYVYGGASPQTGFDCSGFVQWVYGQFGISLPRTSYAQWNVGTHVAYDNLQPGDLVFFTTEGVFANHVGIYIGNGNFISAATPGQGVVVQSLSDPYFAHAYDGATQIINN
ncbi:peptidoglycan-binding protein [Sulfobacillus harzensis]|uniref:Hydrolase Nlp/P60 n=1 Tax=Sulfobacillus harzensis TaxID=2729629 RepID=A0A7Y0L717_9FIRM|nr:peptidoglycan-binding protein [Sulfobacillus harzensis]NMP23625.1 hydrolase Nlp/P60 [Sulfobacillus harzensis]